MNMNRRKKALLFMVIGCFCVLALFVSFGNEYKEAKSIKQHEKTYENISRSSGFYENETRINAEYKEQQKEEEIITGNFSRPIGINLDFSELSKINEDIYAWMYIPGTGISYPVLQSAENESEDFYLMHNLDNSSGYPACVYSQKRNNKDFTDPDTILYGHNMNDGTMFAPLHNYKEEDYFKEHDELFIYLPDKLLKYKIFATFPDDDKLILDYYEDFADPFVFQDYITQIGLIKDISGSHVNSDIPLNTDMKLLTLSTCEKDNTKRYLVIFVLTDIEEY